VHFVELLMDGEVQTAICDRFGLADSLDPDDPFFALRRQIAIQRFLGYDYVPCGVEGVGFSMRHLVTADTSSLAREGGRTFMEEHKGPITNWEEFETYPWPDPKAVAGRSLDWLEDNLPDDMCIMGLYLAHFCEHISFLMGYETMCFALYEQRDLVAAIRDRLEALYSAAVDAMLQHERVRMIFGSDDMGFKTGPLMSPNDLREFVFPGHRKLAQASHKAGRLYLLHSCGNLQTVMPELIHDVGIDAKHSFEDTIESVITAKEEYGREIALLGGIDLDFLCRSTEEQVRQRVRKTLERCMPGGGYCLGTGNSVANYIPIPNYLAMLDEGRRFQP
jgi:uroporphyrinogen decarboxylase